MPAYLLSTLSALLLLHTEPHYVTGVWFGLNLGLVLAKWANDQDTA